MGSSESRFDKGMAGMQKKRVLLLIPRERTFCCARLGSSNPVNRTMSNFHKTKAALSDERAAFVSQ